MRPFLKYRFWNRLQVVHKLMGVVAILMLLFGQSMAVSGAEHGRAGGWIEICGLEGAEMVQLDQGAPQDSCGHCDFCTAQFSSASTGPFAPTHFSFTPDCMPAQFVVVIAEIRPGAEQYWAANRGPPLASEEKMNTEHAYMAALASPVERGIS